MAVAYRPLASYTQPSMRIPILNSFPQTARLAILTELTLVLAFLATFSFVWRTLPSDGIKLHANIDTGIDLFGSRQELLWLVGMFIAMTGGNTFLAAVLRRQQPLAAVFLFGATLPLLIGFLGVLAFILKLNLPP